MAELGIEQQSDERVLTLRLTTGEKVAALHGDLTAPLSAVRHVEVVPDALAATKGLRAPGLALPGSRKIGTWRSKGHKMFVVARRGEPAVRVELEGQPYATLLVSSPDAPQVARRIVTARG